VLEVYGFAFGLGGVLLLVSMFAGGDADADVDADVDLDADADASFDADADADADADHGDAAHGDGGIAGFAAAFLSLRFWTFFATFFGMTGLVAEGFDLMQGTLAIAAVATGMGASIGYGAVTAIRSLTRDTVGQVPDSDAYVGQTARVLLPMSAGKPGKVRIQLHGRTVDMLARTADDQRFEADDRALVVEMDEGVVTVARVIGGKVDDLDD